MRLEDKVAIVTGGGRGIGEAYARGLSREGANVVVVDIDGESAQEVATSLSPEGPEAMGLVVDVGSESDTLRMAQTVTDRFGRIDILVNNAGIFPLAKFTDLTLEQWRKVMSVSPN